MTASELTHPTHINCLQQILRLGSLNESVHYRRIATKINRLDRDFDDLAVSVDGVSVFVIEGTLRNLYTSLRES